MKPLFQRRHYEWLAYWAGRHLDDKSTRKLTTLLADDNPTFQKFRFIEACKAHRAMAALTKPDPVTKATIDAHRRQSADIELSAALRAAGFGDKTNSNSEE